MTTSDASAGASAGASPVFDLSRPVREPDDPQFEARVLRAFVRGGRLASIPARERKKRVILRWLVNEVLPDDAPVEERELNMRIALLNPDVSALRRYLVDAKLAAREGMVYRRAIRVRPTRTEPQESPSDGAGRPQGGHPEAQPAASAPPERPAP